MFKEKPKNTKLFYIAFLLAVFVGMSGFIGEIYYEFNLIEKGALFTVGFGLLFWLFYTATSEDLTQDNKNGS